MELVLKSQILTRWVEDLQMSDVLLSQEMHDELVFLDRDLTFQSSDTIKCFWEAP